MITHHGRCRPVVPVSMDTVVASVCVILRTTLRTTPRAALLLGLVGLAACDGPLGALWKPPLVVADPAPVVTALDTMVPLAAMVDGAAVGPTGLSITLTTEARYLADRPVLDSAGLAAGVVVARAPGVATLRVTAANARPATVRITVAPAGPLVLDVVVPPAIGPDSVVTLHGYRLHDPAVLATVAGGATRTVARDSATYSFRPASTDTTQATCAAPGRAGVDIAGAELPDGLTLPDVRIERAGELAVAPGEVVYLTRAQMEACVMLPASDVATGARYAFVTVDTAWTVPGAEWETPYASGPAALTIARLSPSAERHGTAGPRRIAALPYGAEVARLAGRPLEATPGHDGPAADRAASGFAYMRSHAPLAVADTFTTVETDLGAVRPARPAQVLDVVGGYVVVAAWADLGDDEVTALRARLPMMRQAIERFLDEADDVYQDVFGVGRPRTLEHHEQVVLVVETRPGSATAQRLMIIPIGDGPRTTLEGFYSTFAHEMAHLYHFAYRDRSPSALWRAWNVEGVADYMAAHAGAAFGGVAHHSGAEAPSAGDQMQRRVSGGGAWSAGYAAMGGLLRQFESALLAAGSAPDEARRRVVRAAVTGWGGDTGGEPDPGVACGLRCLAAAAFGPTSVGDILLRAYMDDLLQGAWDGGSTDGRTWRAAIRDWGAGGNVTVLDFDGGAYRLTAGRDNDSELWAVIRIPEGGPPR